MSGLSVIIPSRTLSNLVPCIQAVRSNEPDARIIVVDDGIENRPAAGDGLMYVNGIKPFIFARNINIGIVQAGSDDVVLLNDDALLKTDAGFSLLQRSAEANPDYGIIGSTTNVTGQPLQQQKNIGLRPVPHFAFVCVLIPRRTIDRVGLLDERYAIDYGVEDRDYCEAVTRAGLKVGVHDHCFVDHGSLVSTFRGDPRTPKSFQKNWELFLQKWGRPVTA